MKKNNYIVKPVNKSDYGYFITDIHYAKRFPSISYSFGLYKKDVLCGVVTYGKPFSATLRRGICGKKYIANVLELNRLVLLNNVRNEASFLISKSLKLLRKYGEWIIISFADTSQDHLGTVYQAANFTYHGLSAKRTDWALKSKPHLHGQTVADEFRGQKNRAKLMREKYGDDFYLKPRPRKHRYIYIIGSKKFKNTVKKELKYPEAPYPKFTINS